MLVTHCKRSLDLGETILVESQQKNPAGMRLKELKNNVLKANENRLLS